MQKELQYATLPYCAEFVAVVGHIAGFITFYLRTALLEIDESTVSRILCVAHPSHLVVLVMALIEEKDVFRVL